MQILNILLAEFFGNLFFNFLGSINPTPWSNGIALAIIVFYVSKISGAHLNPSISVVFCLLGYINPLNMILYWAAQIGGAICGSLLISALIQDCPIRGLAIKEYSGCFIPSIDNLRVLSWEAIVTFIFICNVFNVVWFSQHENGYGNVGAIMIGLALTICAYASVDFTGASLNPARVLGSAIVFDCGNWDSVPYYVAGEMIAAAIAPAFIVSWYGISDKPWYYNVMSKKLKKFVFENLEPVFHLKKHEKTWQLNDNDYHVTLPKSSTLCC